MRQLLEGMGAIASQVDAATPPSVKPVGQIRTSQPFKWSVAALIVNLVAVFVMAGFIVLQVFDKIVFNHSDTVVLAQFANQRTVAIATFVLLGIDTLAIVYAATSVAFSGSIGVASFHMGSAEAPVSPPQTTTVTVTSPPAAGVVVDAPPPAVTTPETAAPHPQPDPELPEDLYGPSADKYGG